MPKIAVLLTEGFADWEYAFIAGTGKPYYDIDVEFFAPSTGEVLSHGSLTALVSKDFDALQEWKPNAIVVIGGSIWRTEQAPQINNVLKDHYAQGVTIAGICGGTLALAHAGLLNEAAHTSNAADYLTENATEYSGQARYVASAAAVSDANIITAAGTAPVSFTAAVFSAVGLDEEQVSQFKARMAAEHSAQ